MAHLLISSPEIYCKLEAVDIYFEISEIKRILLSISQEVSKPQGGAPASIYDLADLQKVLHVSRRTLATWMSEGILEYSKIGNEIYVTQKDLDEFLDKNKGTK